MTQPAAPIGAAIGGCFQCMNLTLLTADRQVCFICGRPPDCILPFPDTGGVVPVPPSLEEPTAAPPVTAAVYGGKCPHCDGDVLISVTDEAVRIMSPPSSLPAEEAGAELPIETSPASLPADQGEPEPPQAAA